MKTRGMIILFFTLFGGSIPAEEAVHIGSTGEEVHQAWGEPLGTMSGSRSEVWLYKQGHLEIQNNRVIAIGEPMRDASARKRSSPSKTASGKKHKAFSLAAIKAFFGRSKSPAGITGSPTDTIRVFAEGGREIGLDELLVPGSVTIVDFYADWCGPCRQISPNLERLALNTPNVYLRKVDIVNWKTPVARQYGLRSIPNIRVFDPRGKAVGAPSSNLSQIMANVQKAL